MRLTTEVVTAVKWVVVLPGLQAPAVVVCMAACRLAAAKLWVVLALVLMPSLMLLPVQVETLLAQLAAAQTMGAMGLEATP